MPRVLCAALAALVLAAGVPGLAGAQARSVEALTRRVDSLEQRIAELERLIAPSQSAASGKGSTQVPVAAPWREIANWRRLRENMNYDAVRRILGEPDRVSGGNIAFWRYPNGGQVTFHSGRVSSWTEPP